MSFDLDCTPPLVAAAGVPRWPGDAAAWPNMYMTGSSAVSGACELGLLQRRHDCIYAQCAADTWWRVTW